MKLLTQFFIFKLVILLSFFYLLLEYFQPAIIPHPEHHPSGEPCVKDSECASNECNGGVCGA